jgi:hypothetical protein
MIAVECCCFCVHYREVAYLTKYLCFVPVCNLSLPLFPSPFFYKRNEISCVCSSREITKEKNFCDTINDLRAKQWKKILFRSCFRRHNKNWSQRVLKKRRPPRDRLPKIAPWRIKVPKCFFFILGSEILQSGCRQYPGHPSQICPCVEY